MERWHDSPTSDMSHVNWDHIREVSSTQEAVRHELSTGIADVTSKSLVRVISASSQTAGVAQRGRQWFSPKGSVAMTCAFPWLNEDMSKLPYASLAAVLAVVDTIESFALEPRIKWMNDILLNEKKLAGVLVENFAHPCNTECSMLIIGVGMNATNKSSDVVGVDQPITSLCENFPGPIDLVVLRQKVFDNLWGRLHQLVLGDISGLVAGVDKRLAYKGESINLETEIQSIPCVIKGLNECGHLVVRNGTNEEAYRTGRIRIAS